MFKNLLIAFVVVVAAVNTSSAQLNGAYTIGGASPDYATLSAAVSDLNSLGVSGPVVFNIRDGSYTGSSWQGSIGNVTGASAANTIVFQSQSGNAANCTLSPSGTSSTNYVFQFDGAKYVTVKNLTLNNTNATYGCDINIAGSAAYDKVEGCVLTGNTASSTAYTTKARIYGTALANSSNITFIGNTIDRGAVAAYLYGNGTTSLGRNYVFNNNVFNENYYMWVYSLYMGDITFENNTFNRSGTSDQYFYGLYMYYTGDNFVLRSNEFNNSCNAYYNYCGYLYYSNYYTQNKDKYPLFDGNTFNMTTGTSTYYNYPLYNLYGYYAQYKNNTFNINSTYTSGYVYLQYAMYYGYYSKAENNTYNVNKSGGYVYTGMYYGDADTFSYNKINVTGGAYAYNYMSYYTQNYYVVNNDVKINTTSTIYGSYIYQYTGTWANNRLDLESTSGTIYATMVYYQTNSLIYNNVINWKTSGTSYGLYAYYNYAGTKVYNNTYYSYATGSTNYLSYVYNNSSSYDIDVKNNIFSRSGTNGYAAYVYNKDYATCDYNIYSIPGGNYFQQASPSYTSNAITDWRSSTGLDANSLIYDVPFVNAANKDFRINASSPAAWAVNGRGVQDTSIKTDFAGNPRPFVRQNGVPDLGAYEVSPTSTPPYASAIPSSPVANSSQVFTFAEDTVAIINWGATVPTSYSMRQYTGVQAGPMPTGVGRMYFYTTATASGNWEYDHKPLVSYKEPWLGDISTESNAVIARSSNGGAWEGYNYTNAVTDVVNNTLAASANFDSIGAYTGVENGRIGVRCVVNPTGIAISNITADEADVDWDAVFNPIGYQVYISKSSTPPTAANWASSQTTNTPQNNIGLSGLEEDTKYYVYIRSICGVKDTSGASLDSFVTLITCHDPEISLSSLNSNRVVASWKNVKTAFKYEYVIDKNPTAPAFGTDVYGNNVLVPFLDPGTAYYIHVRTHCNSIYNNSGWSTEPFNTWATNVNSISSESGALVIYPNPAQDVLTVEVSGESSTVADVAVLDITGSVVLAGRVSDKKLQLNVVDLPAGTYILTYNNGVIKEQIRFNKL